MFSAGTFTPGAALPVSASAAWASAIVSRTKSLTERPVRSIAVLARGLDSNVATALSIGLPLALGAAGKSRAGKRIEKSLCLLPLRVIRVGQTKVDRNRQRFPRGRRRDVEQERRD